MTEILLNFIATGSRFFFFTGQGRFDIFTLYGLNQIIDIRSSQALDNAADRRMAGD